MVSDCVVKRDRVRPDMPRRESCSASEFRRVLVWWAGLCVFSPPLVVDVRDVYWVILKRGGDMKKHLGAKDIFGSH